MQCLLVTWLLVWGISWAVAGTQADAGTIGPLAQAEKTTGQDDDPDAGLVKKATAYADSAQRRASEGFSDFMSQVDGFFGDAGSLKESDHNASWARIRLDGKRTPEGDIDFKPSLKLKVVLPETERRFKLLLSTEEDDTESVGEKVGSESSSGKNTDRNASVAIRFIRSARTKGSVNMDLGLRQREGDVQYFTRLNTGYRTELSSQWTASVTNSYYYYNKSGFENKFSFDFRRVLYFNDDFFFRSFTAFNWKNGQKGAAIGQTFGLYTQFGETRSLALEGIAGYYTSLNKGVDDRFRGHEFRVRWRHNVWRPWFYYEVWPSLSWPSTTDYDKSYGLLLRMEVVIGHH